MKEGRQIDYYLSDAKPYLIEAKKEVENMENNTVMIFQMDMLCQYSTSIRKQLCCMI